VREMEGIPSILIEASSLQIACIATRSGSICELLDERSAFLVSPQSPTELALAMLRARDPAERRMRASRAASRAHSLHDPAINGAHLAALMEKSA